VVAVAVAVAGMKTMAAVTLVEAAVMVTAEARARVQW
jgi:hypothetical protein